MKTFIITMAIAMLTTVANAQTDKPNKAAATVEQMQGYYIFTDSKPLAEYEYLGEIEAPGGRGGFRDVQYFSQRDAMIKKAKQDFPRADGLIIHLGIKDFAEVIKFK